MGGDSADYDSTGKHNFGITPNDRDDLILRRILPWSIFEFIGLSFNLNGWERVAHPLRVSRKSQMGYTDNPKPPFILLD